MSNQPWIPYTPDTPPKEGGYYLTCRRLPDCPDRFVLQSFRGGGFSFSGVVAYLEIPPVPQEFKLAA